MWGLGRGWLVAALWALGCTSLPDYPFEIPDGLWVEGGADAAPIDDVGRGDAGPDDGGLEVEVDAEVQWFEPVSGLFQRINGEDRPVLRTPSGTAAALHDFDGDGRPDWLLAEHDPALRSHVYSGGAPFEFRLSPLEFPAFGGLLIADFDNDGGDDALLMDNGPSFAVHTRASGFARGPLVGLPYAGPGTLPYAGVVVDLDADHRLDVLLGGNALFDDPARGVPIFMNRAPGLVYEPGRIEVDTARLGAVQGHSYGRAAAGDYDGDGDADLALIDARLAIFEQVDGRWLDRSAALGLDAGGALAAYCGAGVRWVDFDADGDLDLAWNPAHHCRPRVITQGTFLLRNDGGRFDLQRAGAGLGDGAADWPARSDPGCWWLPSAPGAGLAAGSGPVVWLDVDLDGDEDILVPKIIPTLDAQQRRHPDVGRGGGRCQPSMYGAALYESRFAQGEAVFVAHPIDVDLDGHNRFAVHDLDGDGDLDVAMAGWNGDPVPAWLLRNTWVERGGAARWLAVRAVTDGDGDATDPDTEDDRDAPGVRIDLDLDGPADAPDFAPGPGRLRAAMIEADGLFTVRFGLGERPGPFWLRARFPDGSETRARVPGPVRGAEVVLRDCGRPLCGP